MATNRRREPLVELTGELKRSVLSHLPESFLRRKVLPRLKMIEVRAGGVVPRGDSPDALYIVAHGSVGLFSGEYQAGEVTTGRSLELAAVVEGSSWIYAWKAITDCRIATVPRDIMQSAFEADPSLHAYLHRMVTSRVLQRFRHDLGLLGFNDEQARVTIAALSEISNGDLTPSSGDDQIVIVTSGYVEVNHRDGGGVFRAGDVFVLRNEQDASIKASDTGHCWVIGERKWSELVGQDTVDNAFQAFSATSEQNDEGALPHSEDAMEVEADSEDTEAEEEEEDFEDANFDADHSTDLRRQRLSHLPFVPQHDEMDCGAASLNMILQYYGKSIPVSRMRAVLGVTVEGSSLADMIRGAEAFGLDTAAVEAEIEDLEDLLLPAVALMGNHYVTLYYAGESHVVVGDPRIGVLEVPIEQFRERYSGIVLLLRPNERLREVRSEGLVLWKYIGLLKGNEADLGRGAIVVLFLFILNLVYPLCLQFLFDGVLIAEKPHFLFAFLLAFAGLGVVKVLAEAIRDYLFSVFAAKFDAKATSMVLSHSMALPFSYFSVRRTGDFLSRLDELEKIREFLGGKPLVLFVNLLSIAVFGIALYFYHPVFIAIVLCGIPLYGWVVHRFATYLKPILDRSFASNSRVMSRYIEAVKNLSTVQSLNYAISSRWRWEAEIVHGMENDRRGKRVGALSDAALEFMEYAFNCVILLTAVYLFSTGQLTLGQVIAVGAIGAQMLGPVLLILKQWSSISEILVSFSKIDDLFSSRRENMRQNSRAHTLQGGVELRGVGFRYGGEGSPYVLKDINLTLRPGESVALVGPSGSGKSTLANILNMLYPPTDGEVLFDGVSGAELDLEATRRQIASIMQESVIFTGTVLENIALGDPRPNMKRAIEAAKAADAHGFISRLGQAYLQPMTPNAELSGGERQRICIARAFYLKPRILILDEATSSLDSISEQRIMRGLRDLGKGRTTITIAHRLASIARVDRIVVMDGGRIVEQGTHRALMQRRGMYYQLFRRQLSA